jgi:hypothetical protein
MRFERDPAKAAANLKMHGVSFPEATTVFGDPFELTIPDPGRSEPAVQRVAPQNPVTRRFRWGDSGVHHGIRLLPIHPCMTKVPSSAIAPVSLLPGENAKRPANAGPA